MLKQADYSFPPREGRGISPVCPQRGVWGQATRMLLTKETCGGLAKVVDDAFNLSTTGGVRDVFKVDVL